VSSQVTSRVQSIAGISQISIDPTLETLSRNHDYRAAARHQQNLCHLLHRVTSTQREVIQFQYQATPALAFSGTRDQNGGFGFETRITKEW